MLVWLRQKAAACLLCALAAGPALAEDTAERRMSPQELRVEAELALRAGSHRKSAAYARALLRRDSKDFGALLILSRAARTLQRHHEANQAARVAWSLASTPDKRFAAAMVRAQALSSSGRRTAAQLWLRRAAQIAPDNQLAAVARRDFGYVRARNPWSHHLSFGIAPSSNINNGSKSTTGLFEVPLFGTLEATLTGSMRALSGIEYSMGVQSSYRLRQSARGQSHLGFAVSHRTYDLSSDAQQAAPKARGSDFAFGQAQIFATHKGQAGDKSRPYELRAAVGRTFYGGDPYTQFLDLSARQNWIRPSGVVLQASAAYRWQKALSTRTEDAQSWELGGTVIRRLQSGHRLRYGLAVRGSESRSDSLDYLGLSVAARLDLAKPVFGARIELGGRVGQKEYARSPVRGMDRLDTEVSADVTAVMDKWQAYGFVPTVSLRARQVISDFGQYEADELGLSIGIRSAF